MSILRKKSVPDVIDLTLLQKRGILRRTPKQSLSPALKPNAAGFLDFTQSVSSTPSSSSSLSSQSPASDPFSFLDAAAQASSSSPSPFTTSSSALSSDARELNALKIKIDDLEYKLAQVFEKLEKLESQGAL